MKYIILNANSGIYNHYKWLREDGNIFWPFASKFGKDIKKDDLILLYSVDKKEIKFLLTPNVILKNSNWIKKLKKK